MNAQQRNRNSAKAVMLVAPEAPPYGGMAIQARLLAKLLQQDGTPVCFFAANFPLAKPLSQLSQVPFVRTVIRAAAIWLNLPKRIRDMDVIHVFAASWLYFFLVVAPAAIIGKFFGKLVVVNYRGGDAGRFFRYWGWAAAPILSIADAVTVPSRFLADLIGERFGVPVTIVKNILDESVFSHRHRTTIKPKLIVARHLEEIYGVEAVLRAFRAIQQNYPEASLTIAGTGTQEGRLRALANQWKLQNIIFLGHIDHSEMQAVYNRCDICLNGSIVDNYPGALLEASAAGLIVVSTGAGGIPSMYENGKDALLVQPGDWEALATAVERVLESPALAQELIQSGTALVRSCYWTNVRPCLYRIYGFSQHAELSAQNAIGN